jgi:Domain of unknown function (DUF4160)
VGVPTISRFRGMTISMYFKDHSPPHFHVWSQGRAASIRIDPVELLDGRIDRKQFALVKRWANLHRKELEENWQRARARGTLKPIEPWK